MKLHLKQSRGNNSESMKARVVILHPKFIATHRHGLFYLPVTVKYHDYIPKGR